MNAPLPKVTVLISTFNRPDYLKEAIRSVIHQTMNSWELLVMNDGGVDVAQMVNDFRDDRILYFHDSVNKGLAPRLNFGLKQARGEYIAYLGDDDLYYPNHLEVLSKALDENPGVGVVYSDLYAVQFIKDESNGKRYPLHKFIQVSRDYNRDFMFYFNHTLHVSLMHRKDLALRVGGYDETVTVLIDWNITRKLSFYTDFKYIPRVTGEYYMPINRSDRISVLERQDNEKFRHNLRKIKADLPPEPWPKVDKIAVIFPVYEWKDSFREMLTELIDHISYPARFILVNNDLSKNVKECREALGKIGELRNVWIRTPAKRLEPLAAYRYGAQCFEGDYVYLPSPKVASRLEMRLIAGRLFLKSLKDQKIEGVKWDVEQERSGPFDILMKKEIFLKRSDPNLGNMEAVMGIVPMALPETLQFDFFLHQAKRFHDEGNDELAFEFIQKAEGVQEGGAGNQMLIDLYSKICFGLKQYGKAEEKTKDLIQRGYTADNWIRLGNILSITGRFQEAISVYRKGLEEIGLNEQDLESPIFPIVVPWDFGTFDAFMGLGQCLLEIDDLTESARMFRRAAKLKANSQRPFLGFAKLFLKSHELDKAEEALTAALKKDEKNPETHRLFGWLYQKKKDLDIAFGYYLKAFDLDKRETENIEPIYTVGVALGKWEEMLRIFKEFLKYRPGFVPAMSCLAFIYYRLGEYDRARDLVEGALALDEENVALKDLYVEVRRGERERLQA